MHVTLYTSMREEILTLAISDNFSSLSFVNSSLIFNSSLTLIRQGKNKNIAHQYRVQLHLNGEGFLRHSLQMNIQITQTIMGKYKTV